MTLTWLELAGSMLMAAAAIWLGDRFAETGHSTWLSASLAAWVLWVLLLAHASSGDGGPPTGRPP